MIKENRFTLGLISLITATTLSGCASTQINHSTDVTLNQNNKMAVFPLTNLTETPQADEKASAIASNLLRIKGFSHVSAYTPRPLPNALIPGTRAPVKLNTLMQWARATGASYALSGSVNEWNYKVGMDGEPVVGINLELIDVQTSKVIWSAVGSESGASRTAVSETAIHLMNNLLTSVHAT